MENKNSERLGRILLNETSIILILCSFVVFGLFGYLNIYAIFLESILLVLSVLILIISNLNGIIKFKKYYYEIYISSIILLINTTLFLVIGILLLAVIIAIVATSALIFFGYKSYKNPIIYDFLRNFKFNKTYLFIIITAAFAVAVGISTVLIVFEPTDEFLIDLYSAMKFLSGLNPYNPASTANIYSYFKSFNLALNVTPTMYGGDITGLGYPALAFLIYIPYVYAGKFANLIITGIATLPFIFIYKKFHDKKIALYAVFSLLINIIFIYSAAYSLIGLVWVVFMLISYYFRKNAAMSGIFFGLALSTKQFPAIIFPFFLYMIFRESGYKEAIKWFFYAFLVFIIINGYFILRSPVLYFKDILSPEISHLIGIGFGLSQLSFLNFVYIPADFFTLLVLVLFLTLFILYIKYYDSLKFELFAFPFFIFIFNYRLLITYIAFWPLLSIISIEDIDFKRKIRINKKSLKKYIAIAACVIIIISAILVPVNIEHKNEIKIDSVSVVENNSKIGKIYVNVTDINHADENIYFRGIINETNYNGLLFNYSGNNLEKGKTSTVILTPVRGETISDNITLYLIAYNGTVQGSSGYKILNYNVKPYNDLLYNPPRNMLSLNQTLP